ncbi:hypothetical protein WJX72_011387 [[Myrmecia] bisecta]|uniref:F-box domain-containing protein n=1 Tax=[Myrmecia] bisecta TaxID=41462 RepID=A0AAW1RAA4_9CHLO
MAPQQNAFDRLSDEILLHILGYLPFKAKILCDIVCPRWHTLLRLPNSWEQVDWDLVSLVNTVEARCLSEGVNLQGPGRLRCIAALDRKLLSSIKWLTLRSHAISSVSLHIDRSEAGVAYAPRGHSMHYLTALLGSLSGCGHLPKLRITVSGQLPHIHPISGGTAVAGTCLLGDAGTVPD